MIKCPKCGYSFELDAEDKTGTRVLRSLTPREREVLYALSLGATDAELAGVLRLSRETVRVHLHRVFNKTGMGNRLEAVLFMQRHHGDMLTRR